jgi:hypothetical protein
MDNNNNNTSHSSRPEDINLHLNKGRHNGSMERGVVVELEADTRRDSDRFIGTAPKQRPSSLLRQITPLELQTPRVVQQQPFWSEAEVQQRPMMPNNHSNHSKYNNNASIEFAEGPENRN